MEKTQFTKSFLNIEREYESYLENHEYFPEDIVDELRAISSFYQSLRDLVKEYLREKN